MTFEQRLVGRVNEEPRAWPFDGDLRRRAEVVDPNFDPPRVVRRIGWLSCLRCMRPMFSGDVRGIRSCWCCGGAGSKPIGARSNIALPNIREVEETKE